MRRGRKKGFVLTVNVESDNSLVRSFQDLIRINRRALPDLIYFKLALIAFAIVVIVVVVVCCSYGDGGVVA